MSIELAKERQIYISADIKGGETPDVERVGDMDIVEGEMRRTLREHAPLRSSTASLHVVLTWPVDDQAGSASLSLDGSCSSV